MTGRALYATVFAFAASIAAACLAVAYVTLSMLGNAAAETIAFAFVIALVISAAASLAARAYRKVASRHADGTP